MTLDRPGVRPALIDAPLVASFDELLRFRHVFRNLYVLDLDPRRVADVCNVVSDVHPAVTTALDAFSDFLHKIATAE